MINAYLCTNLSFTDVLMVAGGSDLSSVELIDLTFGDSPIGLSCNVPGNTAKAKVDKNACV